uniref:Uncharacterized protein n=1 Tax=Romanomermis culicivorax TaxID=13658 RepID=A0A915KDZ2_ROMCU
MVVFVPQSEKYRNLDVSSPCPYTETWKKLSPCWKTCGDPSSSTIFARNFPATSIRKLRKLKTASDPSLDRTLLVTSLGDPPNDCVLLLRIQPCPNYLPCPAAVQPGAVLVGRFRRNVKRRGRNRERKFESRRIDYQGRALFVGLQMGSNFTHPDHSRTAFKAVVLFPWECE